MTGTIGQPGRSQEQARLSDCIAQARHTLVAVGFKPEDAALDAEVLARHVLGWDLARLLAYDREPASTEFADRFRAAITRRANREPVAYITGHREFWGLDFLVTPATLIPRPETEFIVEEALRLIPAEEKRTVMDIGTGSGCLAVAIAHDRPLIRAIATDASQDALLVARHNANRLGVLPRARFVRTDLAAAIGVKADLIVSNPPYVPDGDTDTLPADVVSYEPSAALFGGHDGLAVIRRLFAEAPRNLASAGSFIVEFGFDQEAVVRLAAEREAWHVVKVLHDLQGIPRTMVLRR
jgi:release factor glutamine methyltransferase